MHQHQFKPDDPVELLTCSGRRSGVTGRVREVFRDGNLLTVDRLSKNDGAGVVQDYAEKFVPLYQ